MIRLHIEGKPRYFNEKYITKLREPFNSTESGCLIQLLEDGKAFIKVDENLDYVADLMGYRGIDIHTNYYKIKTMDIDEMAEFLSSFSTDDIDNALCKRCKAESGGSCPMGDNENEEPSCKYPLGFTASAKIWLNMPNYS